MSRPLRLLLSYHYYRRDDVDALLDQCFPGVQLDIFADSGAYSAYSVGQPIDVADYLAWVNRYKHRFTAVATPDVIGDPVATARETERMFKAVSGVSILPTFHVGEDWKWLDHCAELSDYIAFGGMVPYTRQRRILKAWCEKAFERLAGRSRVHGFGLTTWPFLLDFPWFSVDSSSWTSGFRYAQLTLFDKRRGQFTDVRMGDKRSLLAHAKLLGDYGVRPTEVQASGYNRDLVVGLCIDSWQRAEDWLNAYWTEKRAAPSGPAVYLSAGSDDSVAAPNRPQGIARGMKVYLSAGAHGGGPNRVDGVASGLKVYLSAGSNKSGDGYLTNIARGVDNYDERKP